LILKVPSKNILEVLEINSILVILTIRKVFFYFKN